MEEIKKHIEAAYENLVAVQVGGEAKIPIGLAMAQLVAAMQEMMKLEKEKKEEES